VRKTLAWHSRLYRISGTLALHANRGDHPKHGIIDYASWFRDRCRPGWTLLDIGSHDGYLAETLARSVDRVYGIEISRTLFERAERGRSSDRIRYFLADARQFDYSALEPVHAVILSNLLEHLPDRIAFLAHLLNAIPWKDAGEARFLIRVPLLTRDWISVYKKELGLDYRLDPTHCVEYTEPSFFDEIEKAGLRIFFRETRFGELYAECLPA
jgi:hypothetical protein